MFMLISSVRCILLINDSTLTDTVWTGIRVKPVSKVTKIFNTMFSYPNLASTELIIRASNTSFNSIRLI